MSTTKKNNQEHQVTSEDSAIQETVAYQASLEERVTWLEEFVNKIQEELIEVKSKPSHTRITDEQRQAAYEIAKVKSKLAKRANQAVLKGYPDWDSYQAAKKNKKKDMEHVNSETESSTNVHEQL